jgi:hypothetical protein
LIPHDLMQHNENGSYKLLGLEDWDGTKEPLSLYSMLS